MGGRKVEYHAGEEAGREGGAGSPYFTLYARVARMEPILEHLIEGFLSSSAAVG
jgi:hypothetical protein